MLIILVIFYMYCNYRVFISPVSVYQPLYLYSCFYIELIIAQRYNYIIYCIYIIPQSLIELLRPWHCLIVFYFIIILKSWIFIKKISFFLIHFSVSYDCPIIPTFKLAQIYTFS